MNENRQQGDRLNHECWNRKHVGQDQSPGPGLKNIIVGFFHITPSWQGLVGYLPVGVSLTDDALVLVVVVVKAVAVNTFLPALLSKNSS